MANKLSSPRTFFYKFLHTKYFSKISFKFRLPDAPLPIKLIFHDERVERERERKS